MKRHPALRELSSDHHQGLVHARRLIRVNDKGAEGSRNQEDVAEAAGNFLRFWDEHTAHHFREEEDVLLPAFARYGDLSLKPVTQVLVEHVRIRKLVSDLQGQVGQGHPSPQTMRIIGEMLTAHIRHEENVLFPLIEEAMPEEALQELLGKLGASARST